MPIKLRNWIRQEFFATIQPVRIQEAVVLWGAVAAAIPRAPGLANKMDGGGGIGVVDARPYGNGSKTTRG